MNDRGLQEAMQVVDGGAGVTRPVGIQQSSTSSWAQIRQEPAPPREPAAGVAREDLPDRSGLQPDGIDSVDVARAQEYGLLAVLLARAPDAALLGRLAGIPGDSTALGGAHAALASAAADAGVETIEREYFNLFVGVGRGELLPYGSYYRTGFLNERPLARLREDLRDLGIERVEGQMESEDHVALLCEVMAGLVSGSFGAPAGAQQLMFERHLAPWLGHFFADMERAKTADFYRYVGAIGRLFVEIEREAFALPA